MAVKASNIFVNLPVKDLQRSIDLFTKIGFEFNPQFTDENAACLVLGDNLFAMLLVESYFQTFNKKEIADTTRAAEAIIALSVDSRETVDTLANNALAAGATEPKAPIDHGFMYTRSFEDPDGHQWEVFHMDMSAIPEGQEGQ